MPRAYLPTYLQYTTRWPGCETLRLRVGRVKFENKPTGSIVSKYVPQKQQEVSCAPPLLVTDFLSKQPRMENADSMNTCETIILALLHPCPPSLLNAPIPRRERTAAISRPPLYSPLPLLLPFDLCRIRSFCRVYRALSAMAEQYYVRISFFWV